MGEVLSVSFSPDGQYLASASGDSTIKLWRVSDGVLVRTLTGHAGWVNSVSFSLMGGIWRRGVVTLTTPSSSGVSDGALVQAYDQETVGGVRSLQFSTNGRFFAYGRGDATVVLERNPLWREGDVNGDGCVDDADLIAVLSAFGSESGDADLNGDGIVDDADLLTVLFNFSSGC